MTHPYDDIIDLPRHVSRRHGQMSMHDRAAQFSPFAALTGYEAVIAEAARWTGEKAELDESRKAALDEILQRLRREIDRRPRVCVTYFVSDARKAGGEYVTETGDVTRMDPLAGTLTLEQGTVISVEDLFEIQEE